MDNPTFTPDLNGDDSLTACAGQLVALFQRLELDSAGLAEQLGPEAAQALYRGEPAAVRWKLANDFDADVALFIRAFFLHDVVPREDFLRVIGDDLGQALADAHLTAPATTSAGSPGVRVMLDIRPHVIAGVDRWVFSDVDASLVAHTPGRDHVLGVGAASLSLLRSTPKSPVASVLDLGTGSGVQLLGQLPVAESITGTDIHPRALALARATLAGAKAGDGSCTVRLKEGSWFDPVAGESFDRIVANPPFVVGPPEISHVYRDSGLELDGATRKVASEAPNFLKPGGTAHLLGAWIHTPDTDWRQRVAAWLPSKGVAAWVIQRDVTDPAHYVATWLKDESLDPRSPEGQDKTWKWLDYFAENDVRGIGVGYIAIQRIGDDDPSDVLAEEMEQPYADDLGPEVEEYFARAEWLRDANRDKVATSNYCIRPGVALEKVSLPDEETRQGFAPPGMADYPHRRATLVARHRQARSQHPGRPQPKRAESRRNCAALRFC